MAAGPVAVLAGRSPGRADDGRAARRDGHGADQDWRSTRRRRSLHAARVPPWSSSRHACHRRMPAPDRANAGTGPRGPRPPATGWPWPPCRKRYRPAPACRSPSSWATRAPERTGRRPGRGGRVADESAPTDRAPPRGKKRGAPPPGAHPHDLSRPGGRLRHSPGLRPPRGRGTAPPRSSPSARWSRTGPAGSPGSPGRSSRCRPRAGA